MVVAILTGVVGNHLLHTICKGNMLRREICKCLLFCRYACNRSHHFFNSHTMEEHNWYTVVDYSRVKYRFMTITSVA